MAAYIIFDIDITDPAVYEEYKSRTPASLAAHQGKFVVRGGTTEVLEGDWNPGRVVVLEFPTIEQAKMWWASEEYAAARLIRQRSANTRMVVVNGVMGKDQ